MAFRPTTILLRFGRDDRAHQKPVAGSALAGCRRACDVLRGLIMGSFVGKIEYVTETCCNCGMSFAMTAEFQRRKLKNRTSFYCPAGHRQHYIGRTEEQKLRDQLDEERRRKAAIQGERDAIAKTYRRIRDRVKNGVCPCCNRSFSNLREHIRKQHPEFGDDRQLRVLRQAFGLTQQDLSKELDVPAPYISAVENAREAPAWAEERLRDWIARSSS